MAERRGVEPERASQEKKRIVLDEIVCTDYGIDPLLRSQGDGLPRSLKTESYARFSVPARDAAQER